MTFFVGFEGFEPFFHSPQIQDTHHNCTPLVMHTDGELRLYNSLRIQPFEPFKAFESTTGQKVIEVIKPLDNFPQHLVPFEHPLGLLQPPALPGAKSAHRSLILAGQSEGPTRRALAGFRPHGRACRRKKGPAPRPQTLRLAILGHEQSKACKKRGFCVIAAGKYGIRSAELPCPFWPLPLQRIDSLEYFACGIRPFASRPRPPRRRGSSPPGIHYARHWPPRRHAQKPATSTGDHHDKRNRRPLCIGSGSTARDARANPR